LGASATDGCNTFCESTPSNPRPRSSNASTNISTARILIIALADKFRLPAICPYRYVGQEGGLITYGFNEIEPYPRSAEYIDRILKGEKPADLPVQAPTKYELVINLKTARTLGLTVPPTLLGRADEVIE
jgi:putative tryptophan/tyrosine transport system substrate-binding protein